MVSAIAVDHAHYFLYKNGIRIRLKLTIGRNFVVAEENVKGMCFGQLQALSDDKNELLECEIARYQVPKFKFDKYQFTLFIPSRAKPDQL